MASFMFCMFKEASMGGNASVANITLSQSVYAALIKSSFGTGAVTDQQASLTSTISTIFANRINQVSLGWTSQSSDVLLTGISITSSNGVTYFDAADIAFSSVSAGQVINGIIIYKKVTADDDSTNLPIVYINLSTVTANGASINVNWDNGVNRIFSLT